MARLNKKIRDKILRNWFESKHEKAIRDQYQSLKDVLAVEFRKQLHGSIEIYNNRDYKPLIASGYLRTCDYTTPPYELYRHASKLPYYILKVMGITEVSDEWFKHQTIHLGNMVKKSQHGSMKEELTVEPVMHQMVKKFTDEMHKIDAQYETLTSVVYSVSTQEKLIELLPEIKQYIPAPVTNSTALIPVEQLQKVRKIL